jgi:hypothetical protein
MSDRLPSGKTTRTRRTPRRRVLLIAASDWPSKVWRSRVIVTESGTSRRFGSVDHEKLLALTCKQVADGRVLKLMQTLTAGYQEEGRQYATPRGTPQGGVISPLLGQSVAPYLTPSQKDQSQRLYMTIVWSLHSATNRRAERGVSAINSAI